MKEDDVNNKEDDNKKNKKKKEKIMDSPYGELFAEKTSRVKSSSKFSAVPNWKLASCIIKFGDDCRQEYLAMQLIFQIDKIFKENNLPIFLKPYRILINSSDSGLIETLTDCISLHQLKCFYKEDPPITLLEHFKRLYGEKTREFDVAQGNFVESLAGYSLVSYLLQIKDRHNGNLMIDKEGHIIHIDFGFILSNSPGSIKAESNAFKLTQEFVDVMGGLDSSLFHYYKILLTRGYLAIRKHYEELLLLVEIMAIGSKLPCFHAGQATIDQLKERFNIGMTEEQIHKFIEDLIVKSYDSWRTRYYDRFQYLTNGILP
eukprot:TRINITY_DN355_c0_g4_i2.p1 TRINITY_DN355_c0_g4~~TRINITY_DN355_c0_g4_i2.p1  ORF type:complete len:346 (+),score=114.03 TRINITY_DN355_c0_g4_i2:89-1039(+)